ncbi:MAG: Do family serine endopeptidase [Myxococcota bacterium]|nr:Do family serine endopeptidase [Myxococcota bacterium]MDW8363865.1 Do family serine endopeptidase [Myxococcales bacterium]
MRATLLAIPFVWLALAPASIGAQNGAASDPTSVASALERAFTAVAERVSASVVSIEVETRVPRPAAFDWPFPFFRPPERPEGFVRGNGSGAIVRSDGYIITNHHVIEDAHRIEVLLRDGRRFTASVVGIDPGTDLAILKIDARNLPALGFADSRSVRPGQWVVAVGSPFGLDYTVTVGVVSAVGRAGVGMNDIEDYIQTDASINPGNSGGPLVNLAGQIIGINTMIVGRGSGIGFAVPADIASVVAEQIIASGTVRRASIGVTFQELTPEIASELGMSGRRGALVSSVVAGGPAERAGVRPGDVIVSVGGRPIEEGRDLLREVLRRRVGETVELGLVRGGQNITLRVGTVERPTPGRVRGRRAQPAPPGPAPSGLGLSMQSIEPGSRRGGGEAGVFVTRVEPGTPAAHAGLRPGDVIVEADRTPVRSPADVEQALRDGRALLRVRRGDGALYTVLRAP